MATNAAWAAGYALQAQADFRRWQKLEAEEDAESCHRLLFLQMACEKLCKARLIGDGTSPEPLQKSHGYIANPLVIVIKYQLQFQGEELRRHKGLMELTRHLAREIEWLNPAMNREQRPDNCEYPWEDSGQNVLSPLTWSFTPLQLLRKRFGTTFVKVLSLAIDQAATDFC